VWRAVRVEKGVCLSNIIAKEVCSLTPITLTQLIVECGARMMYLLLVVEFSNHCRICTKGHHNKEHINRTFKSSLKSRKLTLHTSPLALVLQAGTCNRPQ
jgi:hypothetical protein